ncbi:MAG TPA: cation:proton antiporter [Solirubrobacterales bacterium]|nr:cation:proton antiporter [Solirubrobacterales bacterium]
MEISLDNLLIVVVAGFAAPLAIGLVPGARLPSVVLEIVIGIVIGPAVLGWVEVDEPVEVLSVLGLAFLLFLAGLEIDIAALRGALLRAASLGFLASLVLALVAGLALDVAGIGDEPLPVAVILTSTSLGVIVPVLDDAGEARTRFGQLVIAAASIADFVSVLLLSFLFSGESSGAGTKLVLIAIFVLAIASVLMAVAGAERSRRVSMTLVRLQDTSAQIRIRGAFVLLVGMAVLAEQLGLELILGAFAAGAILNHLDRDQAMTHPDTRKKLAAVGFGVFIPIFFVSSGVRFDLDALFASSTAIASIPAFVAALVLARGLPALLYRGELERRQVIAAALLQATSLPFIVAATQIGQSLGVIDAATSAGFIAAGLVTVLFFPIVALSLLRADHPRTARVPTAAGGSQ